MNDPAQNVWPLWQLIDSAFPIGGFAHSAGLEAAVQLGEVEGGASLALFIETSMRQAAKLGAVFAAETVREPSRYSEIDAVFDAMMTNTVARSASRAQGQAIIATASEVWPSDRLASAKAGIRKSLWFGHWPVGFGLVGEGIGLDDQAVVDAFLFSQLRSLLSAAVRLGVAGSREAQRMQSAFAPMRASLVETALNTPLDDATQVAPVLELLQAQHARLYSRLFVS